MWFKYSKKFGLKLDIKTIKIKIRIRIKMSVKENIIYKSYLRLSDRYIYVYVLFGCSTVVVIAVVWDNCVLGSFLRIWVLFVFDLLVIVLRLYLLFCVSLSGWSCWFLTCLLSCEGYTLYSVCPSRVVYMWSWIFKFDVVYIHNAPCWVQQLIKKNVDTVVSILVLSESSMCSTTIMFLDIIHRPVFI
jgi:hypothetical protein